MLRRFSWRALCALVVLGIPFTVEAANKTWTAAVSGDFGAPGSWTGGVPGAVDAATFNLPGTYTVTFDNNPNPLVNPVLNLDLLFSNGAVTFTSGVGGPYTYRLTGAGGDDAQITGGTLTLGTSGNPLHLTADDELIVRGGSTLNVRFGSQVNSQNASVAASSGGGNGTLIVDGTGSTLSATSLSSWGRFGNTATATFSNGALGSFERLELAREAGSTAVVDVLSGADLNLSGNMTMADNPGINTSTSATLNINGAGSSVTLTSTDEHVVGDNAIGTAVINIGTTTNGGALNTGPAFFTILNTGTVNVGAGGGINGTLNAGTLLVDGGRLNVAQGSTLTVSSDLFIEDGGRATFAATHTTSTNAHYGIGDAGSVLEMVGSASLFINNGADIFVFTGGSLSSANAIVIGTSGNGTLTVSGLGASVTAAGGGFVNWGSSSSTTNIVFRNNATGEFNGTISLAPSLTGSTVTVETGADVTFQNFTNGTSGLNAATLTIDGPGSTVSFGALTVGGTINAQDAGALTVGPSGVTVLNATGTINIDGGIVDLKTLTHNGGIINLTAGSLSFLGSLTVGTNGLLGDNPTLGNVQLTLNGTTTVDALHTLTLNGGSISTGSLVVNGTFAFNSGTVSITGAGGLTIGAGGPFGNSFTLGAGRTINVTNSATVNSGALFVLESGGSFNAGTLVNNGTVVLDGIAAILGSTSATNNGLVRGEGTITANVTNAAAGEIRAQNGKTLVLTGANGANAGTINLQGGTLEFAQALTNGSNGRILGRGTISIGGAGLDNEGHVALSSGITDVFGDIANDTGSNTRGISISGNADVTFWDDVTNVGTSLFRVSAGSSATFFGTFAPEGSITGGGDVYIEADLTPGASPASVGFGGNLFLGAAASLAIELGGTTLGSQFDHVEIDGATTLDGSLDVSLIDGFVPIIGNSFEVLHADAGILGEFIDVSLPVLIAGLEWNVVYSNFSVLLEVGQTLPGDFNLDGVVDAADYVAWRKGGVVLTTPEQYNIWRTHFGESIAGSGGTRAGQNGVPEPRSLLLLGAGEILLAVAARSGQRRSRVFRIRRSC